MRAAALAIALCVSLPLCAQGIRPDPDPGLRLGLSAGIDLALEQHLNRSVIAFSPELFLRGRAWESTLRFAAKGSSWDLSADFRLAPQGGFYAPAVGLGIKLSRVSSEMYVAGRKLPVDYLSPAFFVSAVPLRFEMGGSGLALSFLELRFGPFHPEFVDQITLFSDVFFAELCVVRLSYAFALEGRK